MVSEYKKYKEYKEYNGSYVPHLLEERRAILDREDVCRVVGINCADLRCGDCVFEGNEHPPIEWYIENGYFTKVEVLDISLT